MEFEDFVIRISQGNGSDYAVEADCRGHKASGVMRLPYARDQLEQLLQDFTSAVTRSIDTARMVGPAKSQAGLVDLEPVQEMGARLFDALFTGDIRQHYRDYKNQVLNNERKGLRVRLQIEPGEISALPWEYLYDPEEGEYLCLSGNTPLVRCPFQNQISRDIRVNPPLRVLGMVCSPADLPALDVDEEKRRVETALDGLQQQELVELTWLPGETWRCLQEYLTPDMGPWHVFHFIGHGGFDPDQKQGFLAFTEEAPAGEKGKAHKVFPTMLARLLTDYGDLRVVVLNACQGAHAGWESVYSSTAAALFQKKIDCVIANQFSITDDAAVELARDFYTALAKGLPVDHALAEARKSLSMVNQKSLEWGTPVLYMSSPNGVLLNMEKGIARRAAVVPELKIADQAQKGIEPAGQRSQTIEPKPTAEENELKARVPVFAKGKAAQYGIVVLILLFALSATFVLRSFFPPVPDPTAMAALASGSSPAEETQAAAAQMAAVKATEAVQQAGTQTQAAAVMAAEESRQQAGTQTQAAVVKATEESQQLAGAQTQEAAAQATGQAFEALARTATTAARADSLAQVVQQLSYEGVLRDIYGPDLTNADMYHAVEDFDKSWAELIHYNWWPTGYSPSDFVIRAHSTWESASRAQNLDESGCGFVFRNQDNASHYMITLALDGYVYLRGYEDGVYRVIAKEIARSAEIKGEADVMLVVQGERVVYYVNGQKIIDHTGVNLYQGGLNFVIFSGTDKDFGTRCKMTETELWILPLG